jgi:hypothetical protein
MVPSPQFHLKYVIESPAPAVDRSVNSTVSQQMLELLKFALHCALMLSMLNVNSNTTLISAKNLRVAALFLILVKVFVFDVYVKIKKMFNVESSILSDIHI